METGFYYLQTRYYDPDIGRFISPDSLNYLEPETINGLNLYAYCLNNPVMYSDPGGNSPLKWYHWLAIGVGVALIAMSAGLALNAPAAIGAFGVGALIGSVSVGIGGALIGGAIGYAVNGTEGMLQGAALGFGIGALIGFVVGGIIGYTKYPRPDGIAFNKKWHSELTYKGVDPYSIGYSRKKFEVKRIVKGFSETLKSGKINEPIRVGRDGIINQGNHRLLMARIFKITIDIIIGGMGE